MKWSVWSSMVQYGHSRSFLHDLMVYIYSWPKTLKAEVSVWRLISWSLDSRAAITVLLSESRPHVEKTQSILFHIPPTLKNQAIMIPWTSCCSITPEAREHPFECPWNCCWVSSQRRARDPGWLAGRKVLQFYS